MEGISVREEECEAKRERAKFWLKFLKEFDNYRACGLFANFPSKTTRNKVTSIKRPAVRRVKVFNHVRGTLHGRKKSRLLAGNKKKKSDRVKRVAKLDIKISEGDWSLSRVNLGKSNETGQLFSLFPWVGHLAACFSTPTSAYRDVCTSSSFNRVWPT